jgi:hypothetical protein
VRTATEGSKPHDLVKRCRAERSRLPRRSLSEGGRHLSIFLCGSRLVPLNVDGILRLSEEEAEIPYIDELFVRAKSNTGDITLRPSDERPAHKDRHYLVLKRGQSVEIRFAVPDGVKLDDVRVVTSGFFQPIASVRARVK